MPKQNSENNQAIEYLELESVPVKIEIQDNDGNDKKLPEFSMVAYTGAVFPLGYGWTGIVDLNGLKISSQELPARFQHDAHKGVGHTNSVLKQNGKVTATGVISRETEYAKDVVTSAGNGFPWQVSMGMRIQNYMRLESGESKTVNGLTVKGPAFVFTETILREVSFVDAGADKNTSARIRLSSDSQNFFNFNGELTMPKLVTQGNNNETPETPEAQTQAQPQATLNLSAEETASQPAQPTQPANAAVSLSSPTSQLSLSVDQQLQENRRVTAILHLGAGRFADLEAQAIELGWTVEKFKGELNAKMMPQSSQIQMSGENSNGLGTAVLEAVALKNNGVSLSFLEKEYEPKTLEMADKYMGYGLQEFCQLSIPNLPSYRREPSGWLSMAFSSVTLPGIFSNIANKSLLDGFLSVDTDWKKIVKFGSVTNFHTYTRYRMNGSFLFEPVSADGELKHGQLGEEHYTQQIETYGKMFALTRKMIINDDLGALSDIPRYIGIGAADKINDLVWQAFLKSTTSDGKDLFHASHKNIVTANLDIDGLTAAEIAFSKQERSKGRPLGIKAKYLVVPISLKVKAEVLMKSMTLDGATVLSGNVNPHSGKFEILSSSYLSADSFENSSDSNWYLLADPNRLPVLEVAFLSGKQNPTIERADADFNTLGVQFRGYHDFGVSPQDYRGILKVTQS